MNKKEKVKLFKHQLLVTGISAFALVTTMIGGSYALFSTTSKADEYNVLKVGKLEISYVDTGDGYGDILSLNGAYPISDSEGSAASPYRFSIMNTGSVTADFKIKILYDDAIITEDGCENQLLDQKFVKYKFDNQDPVLLGDRADTDYTVYEADNLLPGSSEIHEIRIWIDENATNEILGKHFHGKVVIESVQSGSEDEYQVEYAIGDSITLVDGSKWHVLETSTSDSSTVTLLSDYNLSSDGAYDTTCGKSINNTTTCNPIAFDTENVRQTAQNSYCTTPEYGCNLYERNGTTVISDSTIKTYLENTYYPKLEEAITTNGGTRESLSVNLPTMAQLATADSKTFSQNQVNFTTNWLTETSYWTKTASDSDISYVWGVDGEYSNSYVQYANSTAKFGVRPVIVVSKTNIQK